MVSRMRSTLGSVGRRWGAALASFQHPDADLQPKRDKDKRNETKNERPQALCLRFRLARPAEEKRPASVNITLN
jgi:hypothetical protein